MNRISIVDRGQRIKDIFRLFSCRDPDSPNDNPHSLRLYLGMDYHIPEEKILFFLDPRLRELFKVNNRFADAPSDDCPEFVLLYINYDYQHKLFRVVCYLMDDINDEKVVTDIFITEGHATMLLVVFDEILYHPKYGRLPRFVGTRNL